MSLVSRHGLWQASKTIGLACVALLAVISCLAQLNGWRVMSVTRPNHSLSVGSHELLTISKDFRAGEMVAFNGAGGDWLVGKVIRIDSAAQRVEVSDGQTDATQTLSEDRVIGQVRWTVPGLGYWLEWLGVPLHLALATLPVAFLVLEEARRLSVTLVSRSTYSFDN